MTPALKQAFDQAAIWHRHQLRKYPGVEVPYMSHVGAVAFLLGRCGFDDTVVIAGLLHDVLEDTPVTYDELESGFGTRVADLVRLVSEEDKSLPWAERKRRALESFGRLPWEAQAIILADKIDNLRSVLVVARHYGDPWAMLKASRAEQLDRFRALEATLDVLPPHPLINLYRETLGDVEAEA